MASTVTIPSESGMLFVGEDKVQPLELIDLNGIPVDMTGWTMVFDIRKKDDSPDPAILSLVPALTGVYNAVRVTNTQRAVVTFTDDNLNLFKGSNVTKPSTYRFSWKRMDPGSETVLMRGDFLPEKATAP
jgi:hypothetical protein